MIHMILNCSVLVSKEPIFTIPPQSMDGVTEDVKGMTLNEITHKDDVYNIELNWLAFNWRVLHMAAEVHIALF